MLDNPAYVDLIRTRPRPVSFAAGYCRARNRHLIAFSIMMNRLDDVERARRLQDRMVERIAALHR